MEDSTDYVPPPEAVAAAAKRHTAASNEAPIDGWKWTLEIREGCRHGCFFTIWAVERPETEQQS